jgi:ElaB/YqjD/DUF883 family membrane-anchored ribosome-binding protein
VANETTTQESQQTGVRGQAADAAAEARTQARDVAHDAREEAGHVTSEAAAQIRGVADEARSALRTQGRQGTERAAGVLDQMGERLRSLAQGQPEAAGDLRRYADQAGERLQAAAGRLEDRGLDGVVDDVQSFARRRPGVFIAIAASAGFLAGRFFRGAKGAADDQSNGQAQGDRQSGPAIVPVQTGPPAATAAPVASPPATGAPDRGSGR